jgi:flagellar hook-associated protein 2
MRIAGFASGFDIDAMVQELMSAHRKPLDTLRQQKTFLEWKREDYRSMAIKMIDFRNNKLVSYNKSTVINAKKAVVTGDSSVLTAKAIGSAASGSLNIKVTSLAASASVRSSSSVGTNISESARLDEIFDASLLSSGKITINGTDITFSGTDTIQSLIDNINNSAGAKVTAFFDYASGQLSLTNKETGTPLTVSGALLTDANGFDLNTFSSASLKSSASIGTNIDSTKTLNKLKADGVLNFTSNSITINGKNISIDPDVDTIQDLIDKINAADANVTASFDFATGEFYLANKDPGSTITVSGDLLTNADAFDLNYSSGTNAVLEVNGMTIERSSNTFTINGVEITLTGTSGSQTTTINVTTDTDAIVESIQSFINDYNAMISAINAELNEERFRNYPPLTDEQKKEFKEDDIKLWQEKARSGTLRNDTILSKVINDLRLAAIADVGTGSDAINITDIGINTGDWTKRGQLQIIDEEKLRKAIEENPEQVLKLFSGNESGADSDDPADPQLGIFNRMRNILAAGIDQLANKAGTSRVSTDPNQSYLKNSLMESELTSLERKIEDYERRLTDMENRYYKQFTAMEVAINRFNAQAGMFANFMTR